MNDQISSIKKKRTKKMSKETLQWIDPHSGARFHAGAAFYDEEYGEYRLVLDGPRTVFSLKAYQASGNKIRYKVYAAIQINGKFGHKVEMGYGYSDAAGNGDIYITIGRYGSMRLVLLQSAKKAA